MDLEFSREAAPECSPRRQPWVVVDPRRSLEGAKETKSKIFLKPRREQSKNMFREVRG